MFKEVGLSGLVDIAFMSFLIYIVLVWFKRTRAAVVLTGMIIFAVIYLVAQQFNLVLTSGVFQLFFAVILFAIVVIFQEEIRRFFEQVAVLSFRGRFKGKQPKHLMRDEVQMLTRSLADLAREKIGALIVVRGMNLIVGRLEGGTDLDGKLSEALLKSIFDPHSIGHDGALVIDNGRVTRFGAHLPLSKNLRQLEHGGTRHAAALGLAEFTDALCLIVSEERGTISYARNGAIREVHDAEALAGVIDRFYRETAPRSGQFSPMGIFTKNYREKLIAVGLATLLWFVQVYGAKVIYRTYAVPVEYAELPSGLEITEFEPQKVSVTFSGPLRVLYFVNREKIRLFLKTLDLRAETRSLRITASNLVFPKALHLEDIEPRMIKVEVKKEDAEITHPSQ